MMQNWDWQQKVDFTALLDSDAFKMQSECNLPSLFKYLYFDPTFLDVYLQKPTIKFTTKSGLDDPFELTRRWKSFGSPPTQEFFQKYLELEMRRQLDDPNFLMQKISEIEDFKRSGMSLSQLRMRLSPSIARMMSEQVAAFAIDQAASILPLMFEHFSQSSAADKMIEDAIRSIGILSVTTDPLNPHMWKNYAANGAGFVMEFDMESDFFKPRQANAARKNLLFEVFYRDDHAEDFWRNPFYLFSVKHTIYRQEKEWRMLTDAKECDATNLADGTIIYTRPAPVGLIKSITFGPKWLDNDIAHAMKNINGFDGAIAGFRIALDLDVGRLVRSPLAV